MPAHSHAQSEMLARGRVYRRGSYLVVHGEQHVGTGVEEAGDDVQQHFNLLGVCFHLCGTSDSCYSPY